MVYLHQALLFWSLTVRVWWFTTRNIHLEYVFCEAKIMWMDQWKGGHKQEKNTEEYDSCPYFVYQCYIWDLIYLESPQEYPTNALYV